MRPFAAISGSAGPSRVLAAKRRPGSPIEARNEDIAVLLLSITQGYARRSARRMAGSPGLVDHEDFFVLVRDTPGGFTGGSSSGASY